MKIVFSDHANNQRVERKIPKTYILETIKKPEHKIKSFKNRQLLQRQFGDKILEVVTVVEEKNIIVVTQYWME